MCADAAVAHKVRHFFHKIGHRWHLYRRLAKWCAKGCQLSDLPLVHQIPLAPIFRSVLCFVAHLKQRVGVVKQDEAEDVVQPFVSHFAVRHCEAAEQHHAQRRVFVFIQASCLVCIEEVVEKVADGSRPSVWEPGRVHVSLVVFSNFAQDDVPLFGQSVAHHVQGVWRFEGSNLEMLKLVSQDHHIHENAFFGRHGLQGLQVENMGNGPRRTFIRMNLAYPGHYQIATCIQNICNGHGCDLIPTFASSSGTLPQVGQLFFHDPINKLVCLFSKKRGTMSALPIVISIVSVLAIGAVCYTIVYIADKNRKMEEYKQALEKLRREQDESETESESEEEFQDLRHHRLIHEPQHSVSYEPAPPDMAAYAAATAQATQLAHTESYAGGGSKEPYDETRQRYDKKMVQYKMPTPPAIEEFNDIRVFYTTSLPVTLEDLNVENCVECELLDAVIPRGDYVVHSQNRTFQVRQPFEASVQTFTDVTIPVGDYSATALASVITTLVTAAGITGFSLSYTTLTKNFQVQDDSVLDLSFNSGLAYDLGWGTSTNLSLGSVQFPIATNGSYEVTVANQSFEVSIDSGAYTTYTIALGTYTATTLGTALNTALSSPLAASYLSDGNPSLVIYHTSGAALDVRLSQGLMALLSQSTNLGSSIYNSSLSVYYSTSARADLYGSRYVEIKTAELNAPHLHNRGVLQAAFLANEITNWRANGADALRRRRFPAPISIRQLTVSFKERHPSKSDENDFYNMELNGLAISMCICFRRLRYKNEARNTQLGAH